MNVFEAVKTFLKCVILALLGIIAISVVAALAFAPWLISVYICGTILALELSRELFIAVSVLLSVPLYVGELILIKKLKTEGTYPYRVMTYLVNLTDRFD